MIALWVYLIGYVLFWRSHVGFMAWYMNGGYGRIDSEDQVFGLVFGSMSCLLWPVGVPARLTYRAWQTYVADDPGRVSLLFPEPKKIETKTQRDARKAREKQDQILVRRREINDHERSNGLELTRWID